MDTSKRFGPDPWIMISVFILILFGLVMVSSASAINSHENFGSNDYYFWHQFFSIGVALFLWFVCQRLPMGFWKNLSWVFFVCSLVSLILVFVPGIGSSYGTANSWIDLGILPNIQPAEFAKLACILVLATIFSQNTERQMWGFSTGLMPFIAITGIVSALVMAQPDFGTTLIIIVICTSIYFAAGGHMIHLIGTGLIGSMLFLVLVRSKQYILNRFTAFLNPEADLLGIGYHIKQSLIAVGSGGFLGLGFGNSRQKFEYLPEAQGDSIFAITSEELGFIGVIVIIALFVVIAWRGFIVARDAKDRFSQLTAVGITSWIVFQALINIMVNLAMMPTTGVPLPFISYGGSSLVATIVGVAILLKISTHQYESVTRGRRVRRTRLSSYRRRKRA